MAKNRVKFEGTLESGARKVINDNIRDITRAGTEFVAVTGTTGTTLTNVVGFVSDILQPGTYDVDINLLVAATANSGFKAALKWGTASMITNTALAVKGESAAATANTIFTTSTDASAFIGATSAYVNVKVKGTITVALAGTIQLQAAQNAAHADETKVLVGSTMSFTPIGATTPLQSALV
jgi:heptaprenylglyceryl phosphate synthase